MNYLKQLGINNLEKEVEKIFANESSGHDIFHLKRTLNLAMQIQNNEEKGDRLVIGIAAFLHDVHRIIEKETQEFCSPKNSLSKVKEIIKNSNIKINNEQLKRILHCIEFHEEYSFNISNEIEDIETLILQDADNLDAIGAIGIGRTFAFGGNYGLLMWDEEDPIVNKKFKESNRDKNTIQHFYSKLLKLKNNMNTQSGKKMANERHLFMKIYLEQFFDEWKGIK